MGKSALLYECERIAKSRNWIVADIGAIALWNPNKLLSALGRGDDYEIMDKFSQIGVKDVIGRGYKSVQAAPTVEQILKDGKQPLLLILDEAQALEDDNIPPSQYYADAVPVLDLIHNGKLGRSVILLAAGLEGAKKGFGKLKISRFAQDCHVVLGPLSKESEHAVIQDWLLKEGGLKEDPMNWISAIAQETHGWPHHILSYVCPAARLLKKNGGTLTTKDLGTVLEMGHEGREQYYSQRIEDFQPDQIRSLAKSMADVPDGKPAEYRESLSSLTKEYGESEAEKLFLKFERKRLLMKSGIGYAVPISSMHNWLVSTHTR